jgi:hypothetical protein
MISNTATDFEIIGSFCGVQSHKTRKPNQNTYQETLPTLWRQRASGKERSIRQSTSTKQAKQAIKRTCTPVQTGSTSNLSMGAMT